MNFIYVVKDGQNLQLNFDHVISYGQSKKGQNGTYIKFSNGDAIEVSTSSSDIDQSLNTLINRNRTVFVER